MKSNTDQQKKFPDGMVPLGGSTFRFACHAGVSCYTQCCRKLDLLLYPYDVIRLKNRLGISSEAFLERYAGVVRGQNPFFPALMLRMADNEERTCPFLAEQGCSVYADRPSACRTYPLERAVDRSPVRGGPQEFYFLTRHAYCKGHAEETEWTVKEWLRDQQIVYYNAMDDLWAEMDTLFGRNPWQGEGTGGPRQLLAFMACYNIDRFRQYVTDHNLLDRFRLEKSRRKLIEQDDESLLKFGFDWLKLILFDMPTLKPKR